jgi:hypothetical protein
MANTPTSWSLTQNPPIGNYGTKVDKRLTTITPTNPSGYTRLSTTSTDPVIQNMEYAIDINGNVKYQYTNATGRQIQYNNIQEMVSVQSGPNQINNWDPNRTTTLFKNSLQTNLTQRTQNIIINQTSQPSPIATPTPAAGAQTPAAGAPPPPTLPTPDNPTILPKNPQTTGSAGNHRYPKTMNTSGEKQDVITFTQRVYTPPSGLSGTGNPGGTLLGSKEQKGTILGTVTLPIQPTISDSNSVSWQQDTLNPLEMAGIQFSESFIKNGLTGGKDAIDIILSTLGPEQENLKQAIISASVGAAIGKNVLARTTGAILNPNIELLFNTPTLRTFSYRFQLSAREKDDTEQIQKIIRFFKKGMAVRRSISELFLLTPNIFEIQYRYKEQSSDHPYINKIKTCALTNFQVDYTPTGSYMTFDEDGSMVSYVINLTFEELQPIYQDEYDTLPAASIGY